MNKNKTLVILGTALNPDQRLTTQFGEKRIRQMVDGFESMVEVAEKFPNLEFVIVDNTITADWQMPESISKSLEHLSHIKKIFFYDNELASRNKGCGLITAWNKVFSEIDMSVYDYCIYYEPRQLLLDFSFFETFTSAPDNYFLTTKARRTASTRSKIIQLILKIIPLYYHQYWVGLFSLETKAFQNFSNTVNLQEMAEKGISLEDIMYQNLDRTKIKHLKRLGMAWHNSWENKYIVF